MKTRRREPSPSAIAECVKLILLTLLVTSASTYFAIKVALAEDGGSGAAWTWATVAVLFLGALLLIAARFKWIEFSVQARRPVQIRIRPLPQYLKENPGSPFILTFILSLMLAAATYSSSASLANDLVKDTFLLLIVGIALQAIALARKGSQEDDLQPDS